MVLFGPMKLTGVFHRRCLVSAVAGLLVSISVLAQNTTTPVVSLELVERDAAETRIDQNAIFWGEFRVLRTGSTNGELLVFLNTQQGSARLGEDYWLDRVDNGSTVRFRAGESAVNVRLYPIDDDFYEGDETVFFHLMAPPYANPLPDPYQIDYAHSTVAMVIHDNDPVTTRLDITAPRDGQHFQAGETIELRAQIIGPGSEDSWGIEFFDGDQLIGTTVPNGGIWWSDAIGGRHEIRARAYNPAAIPGYDILEAGPIVITVGPGPAWPVVSITANGWRTAEPCPTCLVAAAVFVVTRTGPTNEALNVFMEYDGTATYGVDYRELPREVTIPAGKKSAQVLILAIDDLLAEGPEIVRGKIAIGGNYIPSYFVSEAMAVIFDNEPGAPEIRLDIMEPKDGAQFRTGGTIKISAWGVWTQGEVDGPVQFFAGDKLIGQTPPPMWARPTIPGLPSVHTIFWTNPPAGEHVLTARFAREPFAVVTSPPVKITVGASGPLPLVWIEATGPIAEESSYPLRRLPLRGEFTISRSGPTNDWLPVFVHYSGTATPGVDVRDLPFLVNIPPGATYTKIDVAPVDDGIPEGVESLIAALSHCPPETDPPMGIPCFLGFEIDPARSGATVWIADNAITRTSVVITNPKDGSDFNDGEPIPIEVVATDLDGYVPRMEFFANGRKIGEENIAFIRPPDPGQPQTFRFVWREATPGRYALTARATDNDGGQATSAPVQISVGASEPLPIVTVSAPDPFAVEPILNSAGSYLNTATFRIRRHGPTNGALTVTYSLGGTAENGVDYEKLGGAAMIPAGQRSVVVIVRPRPDSVREGVETVRLRLEDPPSPATYRVGRKRAATAVISESPWFASTGAARCAALPGGLIHVCFAADSGTNFRIEATSDWQTWETLYDATSNEGAWHFIDGDTESCPRRFYRLRPEPVYESDDP
jgi:Calx-beta domain-containing protein/Big-like domain-containing protein